MAERTHSCLLHPMPYMFSKFRVNFLPAHPSSDQFYQGSVTTGSYNTEQHSSRSFPFSYYFFDFYLVNFRKCSMKFKTGLGRWLSVKTWLWSPEPHEMGVGHVFNPSSGEVEVTRSQKHTGQTAWPSGWAPGQWEICYKQTEHRQQKPKLQGNWGMTPRFTPSLHMYLNTLK